MSNEAVLSSYHNHTEWSDGSASIEALIESAQVLGITDLGISDHLAVRPPKGIDWTMPKDQFSLYARRLQDLRNNLKHPQLRCGLEIDFLPDSIDEMKTLIRSFDADYLIGSVHFVDGFQVDDSAKDWQAMTEDQRNHVWRVYWKRVQEMARSGLFDIVGHLDLPKKFGYRPTVDLRPEIDSALQAISQAGMVIEINTSGRAFPANEMYPAPPLLNLAKSLSIPIVINADAHEPAHLTRWFPEARSLAKTLRFTHTTVFEKRQKTFVPLP